MSSKKLPVSINIFPTLDYVELIQYDEKTGEIDKASSLPCQFDLASRQMMDPAQMSQAIHDLYTMNRLPLNTPAVLILPSFFTREIELPTEFTREELRFALLSEAERFYIFKKIEPQIDWVNLDESRLLYSAFPKSEIEKYAQIFQEQHIPLLGIELSYFSILRGLVATGAITEEIENRGRWCLLVISEYSFFASVQEGLKIQKTTDAPLSLSDEDEQSAVNEIQQDFEGFIEGETFNKLIVVNNTARVSSEALLSRLNFIGNLILIEQNAQTLRSRGAENAPFPCSLEGIGGVFYAQFPELARVNFLPETSEDLAGIMHYQKQAFKWLAVINAGVFVLSLAVWGIISLIIWQKEQERLSLGEEVNRLAKSANTMEVSEINRKRFIKGVVDQNAEINNLLVRLGSITQKDVWLEKITLIAPESAGLPMQVAVEGKALNLDQVTPLPNLLKGAVKNDELEVSNAAPANSTDGQSYYTWTIQNKSASAKDQKGVAGAPAGG